MYLDPRQHNGKNISVTQMGIYFCVSLILGCFGEILDQLKLKYLEVVHSYFPSVPTGRHQMNSIWVQLLCPESFRLICNLKK